MRRTMGFTLIEISVTLVILSILATIAIHSLAAMFEATRSSAARSELYDTWITSVRHSVTAGQEVVLCPGNASGCRGGTDWSSGWIAFSDADGNRMRDPTEHLLHVAEALPGKVHLRSTAGRTRLLVQPFGSNAGSNVTFTLCDGRGPARATTVVLANFGRIRQGVPSDDAARSCMADV